MKEIFKRHPRYGAQPNNFSTLPENLWVRCPACNELIYEKEYEQALRVCPKCKHHAAVTARERIAMTLDEGSFQEHDPGVHSIDPLHFRSPGESYGDKLHVYAERAGSNDAFLYGTGTLDGQPLVLGVTEFKFAGASMGAAFGEKVARAMELAQRERLPLVIFSNGGGARMQEGSISLLQMAKTVAALDRLKAAQLPFFSVMTDNCLGGITASYAMLGDVNLSEPGAYIGFAGRRVIEETMRQKLPQNAARAEFLQQHGMVDMVVSRGDLPGVLSRLVRMLVTQNRAAPARRTEQSAGV